ncbi:hypothetical protein QBC45DRAFT_434736 [Copromyces sp. CBS 386.78]|nr:hypothetical protein QBC45DRAFT_434736 [Copromyces sp. CBS 386.78]
MLQKSLRIPITIKEKKNPYILLVDNTYKVNRFNLPLLNIISINALSYNFNIGFGLLSGESKPKVGIFEDLILKPYGRSRREIDNNNNNNNDNEEETPTPQYYEYSNYPIFNTQYNTLNNFVAAIRRKYRG